MNEYRTCGLLRTDSVIEGPGSIFQPEGVILTQSLLTDLRPSIIKVHVVITLFVKSVPV